LARGHTTREKGAFAEGRGQVSAPPGHRACGEGRGHRHTSGRRDGRGTACRRWGGEIGRDGRGGDQEGAM